MLFAVGHCSELDRCCSKMDISGIPTICISQEIYWYRFCNLDIENTVRSYGLEL